ncbi:NACHT domain-containing protein [Thermoflavimicrobium daqui]|uniref:NACHT domain-containing protein n=1 Tax=Thermoflavimicrobium daqui TaxID=2137476 RepID=A0A364K469_9BACL|nr:hypothetical protein [Thermoflavimicrobium daqui]RAL24163.1 hypothetical protein DL897_10790 [Thermoflavimicrobium daqui]
MIKPFNNWERCWMKRVEYKIYHEKGISDNTVGSKPKLYTTDEISQKSWLVILGEPGIGKTTVLRSEYEKCKQKYKGSKDEVHFIDLRHVNTWEHFKKTLFQQDFIQRWIKQDHHLYLFIDHVDDIIGEDQEFKRDAYEYWYDSSFMEEVYGLDEKKDRHRLTIRMACRTGVWASGLTNFIEGFWWEEEECFGVYQLLPLNQQNVIQTLTSYGVDQAAIESCLQHLQNKKIASFVFQPEACNMFLQLFLNGTKSLPHSKVDLYEQTCRVYCKKVDNKTAVSLLEKASEMAAMIIFSG